MADVYELVRYIQQQNNRNESRTEASSGQEREVDANDFQGTAAQRSSGDTSTSEVSPGDRPLTECILQSVCEWTAMVCTGLHLQDEVSGRC